jgi:uncharacterized delta-60 repeat protein
MTPELETFMRKLLAVVVLIAGLSLHITTASAGSTSGSLDGSFAGDGIAYLTPGIYSTAYAVVVQSDGKIVVAGGAANHDGTGMFALARYNRDGTLDHSFSGNGLVRTRFGSGASARAVAIQPNGRIVVGGTAETRNNFTAFAVARYLSDGSLDRSFSGNGKLAAPKVGSMGVSEISDVAVGSGRIVASAYVDDGSRYLFGVLALTRHGMLDQSFSGDGVAVSRFGRHDAFAESVAIQPDGAIVAAGGGRGQFAIARYLPGGALDQSFGGHGKRPITFGGAGSGASAVSLQDDGRIVVAGTVRFGPPHAYGRLSIALARCNPDGTLDTSFAADGKRTTSADGNLRGTSLAIQSDGKVVVGGEATPTVDEYPTDFALARYTTHGRLDASFADGGIAVTSFHLDDWVEGIALQPNDKIIAVGPSQGGSFGGSVAARYLP